MMDILLQGLAAKSSFARDRLVECYFWSVGSYPEPENCLARSILSRLIAITTVIDDVYDAFGLIDELEVFTDAFERCRHKQTIYSSCSTIFM